MTNADDPNSHQDPADSSGLVSPSVGELLADPMLWTDPSPKVEDDVLAAVAAEPPPPARSSVDLDETPIRQLDPARRRRPRRTGPLLAAAAVLVAMLGGLGLLSTSIDGAETFELAGAGDTPSASAVAQVEDRSNGVRIVLEVDGLPPAPTGTFYAAWVIRREPPNRVGAGTFHLQADDGPIELWSGVPRGNYPMLMITLQDENDPGGAGRPVLQGLIGP